MGKFDKAILSIGAGWDLFEKIYGFFKRDKKPKKAPNFETANKPTPVNPQFEVVEDETDLPDTELEIDFRDGPGGYLYKPEGDHSNKPVILLREGIIAQDVFIVNLKTDETYEFKISHTGPFSNGNRHTWRAEHDRKQIRQMLGRGKLAIEVVTVDGQSDRYPIRGLKKRID